MTRESLYSAFSLQFRPEVCIVEIQIYLWFYLNLSTKYDTNYNNVDQRVLSGVERTFKNVTAQTQKRLGF